MRTAALTEVRRVENAGQLAAFEARAAAIAGAGGAEAEGATQWLFHGTTAERADLPPASPASSWKTEPEVPEPD